jgi:DNA-binding PadR family transcriptional regulator
MRFEKLGRHMRGHTTHPHHAMFGERHSGRGRRGRPDDFEGGGPRRRFFDQGDLRLVLLKLIADEPRHGYDCIRAIEELTGGSYAPSPGVVYPTLSLLDEMALVAEAAGEEKRRKYLITEAGTAHLAEHAALVEALFARMSAAGQARTRTEDAPVRRAMGNLRQVLMQRIGASAADRDTSLAIATVLDEAAQKIERL